MIRTVSMPVGSSTRTVSPSTTSTTVPARAAGVGASVGVGSEVGDAVGATDGDSDADAVRVGVGGDDDRRDTLVSAAGNGSSGNDDRANDEQADLLARHSAVKLQT